MSDSLSLADRAVHALASVSAVGEALGTDDPHRYLVWSLREAAKGILSDAFNRVESMAYLARDAGKVVKELKGRKESGDAVV